MQLLFYVCLITWFIDLTLFTNMFNIGMEVYKKRLNHKNIWRATVLLVGYSMTLTLTVLITLFFKFHFKMVVQNTTTIESLDKQNAESNKKVIIKTTY